MSCNIIFQNFDGTCYPGSTISGYVVCTFASRTNIRGVTVKLRGREHTSWTETETYTTYETTNGRTRAVTRTRTVYYSGDNKFLAVNQTLIGKGIMDNGRFEFPFSFTLPSYLPSNFQGAYGYVAFYIKATVDIPWALDYEDEKRFNVNVPVDLNDIRAQLQMVPVIYQDEKTICCGCCASGPITLDLHLQKEAFVVGEVAKIRIAVTNMSNKSIAGIHLKLERVIRFSTTSPSTKHKYHSGNLASMSESGVGAHGQRTYELDLQIPSNAAVYNFNRCSLFEQSFFLKVEASIPGFHNNMKVKTKVVLGHIPLRDAMFQQTSCTSSAILVGPSPPPPYSPYPEGRSMNPNFSIAEPTAPLGETIPSAPTKRELPEEMFNPSTEHGRW